MSFQFIPEPGTLIPPKICKGMPPFWAPPDNPFITTPIDVQQNPTPPPQYLVIFNFQWDATWPYIFQPINTVAEAPEQFLVQITSVDTVQQIEVLTPTPGAVMAFDAFLLFQYVGTYYITLPKNVAQ